MNNIVKTAIEAGSFSTLVNALEAADLVETLSEPGPFTVFAPTDEAFSKLSPGTVEALLKDPKKLKNILIYHVVLGKMSSEDVMKLASIKTVQGQNILISVQDAVKINDATIIKPDVLASNGVIHVIDTVILPE